MSTDTSLDREHGSFRTASEYPDPGHDLVHVSEYLPGDEPTDYDVELSPGPGYQAHFWRCRNCGQERNRRDEFREPCAVKDPALPIEECGYSVDQPRTRRALTEDMTVRFGEVGPAYSVQSESGNSYEVDVHDGTCTCLDYQRRDPDGGCKHFRRVVIGIEAGSIPRPDGSFQKSRTPRATTSTRRSCRSQTL